MSQPNERAEPPWSTMACATSAAPAVSMSATATAAPSRARRWALAAPIPLPPPTTTAILPRNRSMSTPWILRRHNDVASHCVGGVHPHGLGWPNELADHRLHRVRGEEDAIV